MQSKLFLEGIVYKNNVFLIFLIFLGEITTGFRGATPLFALRGYEADLSPSGNSEASAVYDIGYRDK